MEYTSVTLVQNPRVTRLSNNFVFWNIFVPDLYLYTFLLKKLEIRTVVHRPGGKNC